ncbi:MAG TPA: hypothetical protein PLM33_07545, partial [Acidobacteriota bacterium]|nr:hypothetical protein [Acidobacteriota bacterium]
GGVDRINAAVEELTQASHRLAEVIYQASQGQEASAGASQRSASSGGSQDEVVDAEYVDVDDKK